MQSNYRQTTDKTSDTKETLTTYTQSTT